MNLSIYQNIEINIKYDLTFISKQPTNSHKSECTIIICLKMRVKNRIRASELHWFSWKKLENRVSAYKMRRNGSKKVYRWLNRFILLDEQTSGNFSLSVLFVNSKNAATPWNFVLHSIRKAVKRWTVQKKEILFAEKGIRWKTGR